MKIYPQTAPEIPTGESSIGWEVGGAGWATVPPLHPPRGSEAVSANSPGSPGLRKQGPVPRREGRVARTPAWGSAGPASLSGPPAVASRGTRTRAHTRPGSTCLALVPSSHHCFRLRRVGGGGAVGDARALEGGLLRHLPLGQPPCCLDGTIIALEGQGRSRRCNQVRGPQREGLRPFPPQAALAAAWTAPQSCPKVSLLSSQRACWGSWGPPQAARGPQGRVGSRLCPSCLLAGVQTQSRDKKILW